MKAYYNEFDRHAAAWLRELIKEGHIAPGDVDERSITDVTPEDVKGYCQCHYFAGIDGWPLALRMAGVPDDYPIWTGSCPCQDFSNAGRKAGFAGDRDLWPEMYRLIKECQPNCIFGEQVDDAPEWYDRTSHDLELLNYACGSVVVPACCVGAPHQRDRLYWMAHSDSKRDSLQGRTTQAAGAQWEALPQQQLPGLLQPHSWPTLSSAKLWISTHGLPSSLGVSAGNKCIGNAIVPQVAAEFIKAAMEK